MHTEHMASGKAGQDLLVNRAWISHLGGPFKVAGDVSEHISEL